VFLLGFSCLATHLTVFLRCLSKLTDGDILSFCQIGQSTGHFKQHLFHFVLVFMLSACLRLFTANMGSVIV